MTAAGRPLAGATAGSAQADADRTDDTDRTDVAEYALRLGDDALITAQRLGEWISRAPELEEDVALGNIGLDELGQARALLGFAGSILGRSEDELAYFRSDTEFRCCHLVSLPRGDFADCIARLLVFGSYQLELHRSLLRSQEPQLAAIAAKAVKEVTYHVEHAAGWAVRLGDGTDESRARLTAALDRLWPSVAELFDTDALEDRLAARGVCVPSDTLRDPALARVEAVLADAGLTLPTAPRLAGGGRHGRPAETLGYLLAEMQVLARAHPGAQW